VNQEDSEQNEVDGMKKAADSAGKMMVCFQSLFTPWLKVIECIISVTTKTAHLINLFANLHALIFATSNLLYRTVYRTVSY